MGTLPIISMGILHSGRGLLVQYKPPATRHRQHLLPVEVVDLLAGLGLPIQGLQQQVVGLG